MCHMTRGYTHHEGFSLSSVFLDPLWRLRGSPLLCSSACVKEHRDTNKRKGAIQGREIGRSETNRETQRERREKGSETKREKEDKSVRERKRAGESGRGKGGVMLDRTQGSLQGEGDGTKQRFCLTVGSKDHNGELQQSPDNN